MPEPSVTPAAVVRRDETLSGRVLVVDDELINRTYLRKLLLARGCEVIEAAGGEEAWRLAQERRPDVVLADVMMPGMNGYELCERVKNDPNMADIAVIMVTARAEIQDLEQGFALGAFDYIRKPFNPRELVVRVRNALLLKRSNDELKIWQRRVSRELEVAGGIQRCILGTTPWLGDGVEVWMAHQPSQHVGGDVFDIIPLPDGRVCVYMGDVSGHGVGPAMVSSLVKALLAGLVRDLGAQGPGAVIDALRKRFDQYVQDPEVYVTLVMAILDPAIGAWRTVNCGHPSPILLVGGDDRSSQLSDRGELPIGINTKSGAVADTETLVPAIPDSLLVLYTDGITEARLADSREECGVERLVERIRTGLASGSLDDPVGGLIGRLAAEGYNVGRDDCSVLAVRQPAAPPLLARDVEPSLQAVDLLGADVAQALRTAGWGEYAAAAVRLMVVEHGVNVLRHGQSGERTQLHCQLRVAGGAARLVFHDMGREWQFEEALARVQRRARADDESGRGLQIIRALASGIFQYRRDNSNVTLYKIEEARVSASPAEEAP